MSASTPRLKSLMAQLHQLRAELLVSETALAPMLEQVHASYRPSARNLAHYLALRHRDLRPLQQALDQLGLASLGQAEADVLVTLERLLGILQSLVHPRASPAAPSHPRAAPTGQHLLEQHANALLGPARVERNVRIMVTLPAEAASDFGLVRQLVESGMDIARINCAHDDAAAWLQMAAHVRRASKAAGWPVRVLMDLGGPKLRTGAVREHAAMLKLRPQRDAVGRMLAPALLGLRARGSLAEVEGAPVHLGIDPHCLAGLQPGDALTFKDASGSRRSLHILECQQHGALAQCSQTSYLLPETRLQRSRRGAGLRHSRLADLPSVPGYLQVQRGSHLRLLTGGLGHDADGAHVMPCIACTLPQVFAQVRVGERIWFDDGRIGGVIVRIEADSLEVEITHARDGGAKLRADKGINLPDTQLDLPALTDKDLQDLSVVAKVADMVGLSFVQCAADVQALRKRLRALKAPALGIMLKIETRRSFEHLIELLLAAMGGPAAGVMIARGDLAVECGYERLAEVQEEILWAAQAAHMPVIWATQVLETLAKTGLPTRAEITDAAMGERAECVMLNKGPHILEAIFTLHDILLRMQAHQDKKQPLLRALHAWMSTPHVLRAGER